jgi:hypothetical protein
MDSNGFDAHATSRVHHTASDFATIGDKNLLERFLTVIDGVRGVDLRPFGLVDFLRFGGGEPLPRNRKRLQAFKKRTRTSTYDKMI